MLQETREAPAPRARHAGGRRRRLRRARRGAAPPPAGLRSSPSPAAAPTTPPPISRALPASSAGRITASLPPSLVTRYGAKLALRTRSSSPCPSPAAAPTSSRRSRGRAPGRRHHRRDRQPGRLAAGRRGGHLLPQRAGPERSVAATKSFIATLACAARLVAVLVRGPRACEDALAAPARPPGSRPRLRLDAGPRMRSPKPSRLYVVGRGPEPWHGARDRLEAEGNLGPARRGAECRRDPPRPQGRHRPGLPGPRLRPQPTRAARTCAQLRRRARRRRCAGSFSPPRPGAGGRPPPAPAAAAPPAARPDRRRSSPSTRWPKPSPAAAAATPTARPA